jgi:hypothetical protein
MFPDRAYVPCLVQDQRATVSQKSLSVLHSTVIGNVITYVSRFAYNMRMHPKEKNIIIRNQWSPASGEHIRRSRRGDRPGGRKQFECIVAACSRVCADWKPGRRAEMCAAGSGHLHISVWQLLMRSAIRSCLYMYGQQYGPDSCQAGKRTASPTTMSAGDFAQLSRQPKKLLINKAERDPS